MKLSISRNTLIATPLVQQSFITALKNKYDDVLVVEVDLHNPRDLDKIEDKRVAHLEKYIQILFTCYDSPYELDEIGEYLYSEIFWFDKNVKFPDYFIIIIANWEYMFYKSESSFQRVFSVLSYWVDHDFIRMREKFFDKEMRRDTDYYIRFVEPLFQFRHKNLVILSQPL